MANQVHSAYGNVDRGVLQAIGLVVVNFSQVQEALAFGVNVLMVGVLADDAADLMLRKLGFRELVEAFAGLYQHRFPGDDFREVKDLCKELGRVNDARNHLIHSFWTLGDAAGRLGRYRKAVRRGGPKKWAESVSESDVIELAERANKAYGRVLELVVGQVLPRIDNVVPKRE